MEPDYQTLIDAIPLMVFVVDEDVRVQDLNAAATAVFGGNGSVVLDRRGGEVLHCLHS